MYGYAELVEDPQIAHNGTFVEYDHPTEGRVKTPGFPDPVLPDAVRRSTRGAPLVGEHTREVLREAGYDGRDDRRARRGGRRRRVPGSRRDPLSAA